MNIIRRFSSRLRALSSELKLGSTSSLLTREECTLANFDIDEIVVGDQLQSGKYSDMFEIKVFRQNKTLNILTEQFARDTMSKHARRKRTNEGQFAIKHIRQCFMDNHHDFEAAATNLSRDAEMMTAFNHKNIAKLRGTSLNDTEAYYITGRYDSYFLIVDIIKESLEDRLCQWRRRKDMMRIRQLGGLVRGGRIENDFLVERLSVAYEIADGLEYIHEHRIVHKNIQQLSIGFNSKNEVQIHDLGSAVQVPGSGRIQAYIRSSRRLTHDLASPELEAGEAFSIKTDVFSFTRLLCEILTLRRGEGDSQSREGKSCIREFRYLAKLIPKKLFELLQKGLSLDPESRPTMTELRVAIREALSKLDTKHCSDAACHHGADKRNHRMTQVRLPLVAFERDSIEFINDDTETSMDSNYYWENPFSASVAQA